MKPPCIAAALFVLTLAAVSPAAEPMLTLDLGNGVKLDLVRVKKGTFRQGSPPTEAGRNDDEALHPVTLTRDFYIGKFPITRGQFTRFAAEMGYRTEAEKGPSGGYGWDGTKLVQRKEFTWRNPGFQQTDDHPVTVVTYDDARAFAAWLGKRTGRGVDLPTEAQWEYACRAGTTTRFYGGDTDADAGAIAWFKANAGDGTRPVGQKKPNAFGLNDMSGNVFEWCRDWYGPYPAGAVTDPEEKRDNLSSPPRRVLRGGSWLRDAKRCRSAARYRSTPGSRNAENGFRVLVLADAAPAQGRLGASATDAAPFVTGGPADSGRSNRLLGQSFPGGLVCVLLVVGGVIALFMILVRLGRRVQEQVQGQPTARPGRPTTWRSHLRPVTDGFWLHDPLIRHGSTVHYRYRANGGFRTGRVLYEPGPQGCFVYTGGLPADIEVTDVVPPEASPAAAWEDDAPPDLPSSSEPLPPAAEPFTGFPAAY